MRQNAAAAKINSEFTEKAITAGQPQETDFKRWGDALEVCAEQYGWDQLDFYAITNALNAIHNSIRNQTTEIYSFLQSDKNAIAYLTENGFDENQIRNLGQFEYLWRNLRTGENNFSGKAKPADGARNANAGHAVKG